MVALAGKQWVIDQEQNIQEKTVNVNNKVYSFKTAPVIENLQLGSVNKNNTINEKDVLSAKIENFATEVKKHGIELYKGAYEKLEEVTVYKLPSLSAGEDITEEDKAKVAVALEKVNADFTTAETTYKADTAAFNAAYAAYKTAATAYGITQQLTSTIEKNVGTKWSAYVNAREAYEIRFLTMYWHYRQPSKLQKMSLKQKKMHMINYLLMKKRIMATQLFRHILQLRTR